MTRNETGTGDKMEIKDKRNEILDEVSNLIEDVEDIVGNDLAFIRGNVIGARNALLDDAEFNYDVRLALHQIRVVLESKVEEAPKHLVDQCDALEGTLEQRAELPPRDELSR